jgi:VWFA-related protein
MRFNAILVGGLAFALSAGLSAEQTVLTDQVPTFRARADVVQLDVLVLDGEGRPVRGLAAADFTVLKDGRPQSVVAFAAVEVPDPSTGAAAWTREVGPDVASNRLDARRVVVIVMDDYETRLDPRVVQDAKAIATAAVGQLGPTDLAAVVYVLNRDRGQELTVDRGLLRAAVERFVPSGIVGTPDGRFSASVPSGGLAIPAPPLPAFSGACYLHDCALEALRNVGEVLGAWPGARKTVVLVSPGKRGAQAAQRLAEADEVQLAVAALQNANVTVYEFDPHGLQTDRPTVSYFGGISEITGGRSVTDTNAPADLIPQMFRENSAYYLLGIPSDDKRDGQFHRITVQVNRPGVRVRSRTGYYAATDRAPTKSAPPSAIDRALSGGLPTGDLPVSITVAPFATAAKPGSALAVVARLDHDPNMAEETVLEFVAAAFNDKWKQITAVTQRFTLSPGNPGARFSEMALRLNLPPGRYQVRAAVRNTKDNRTGSVYASVSVPDFAREPLSLSGLVVERRSSGGAIFENLVGIVPVRPTTARLFSANERVAVVGRVYERRVKALTPARVVARIVDGQDRTAFTAQALLEPSAFDAQRQADYLLDLPLDRLADGEYLLVLDVSAASASARRTLRFTVRR